MVGKHFTTANSICPKNTTKVIDLLTYDGGWKTSKSNGVLLATLLDTVDKNINYIITIVIITKSASNFTPTGQWAI